MLRDAAEAGLFEPASVVVEGVGRPTADGSGEERHETGPCTISRRTHLMDACLAREGLGGNGIGKPTGWLLGPSAQPRVRPQVSHRGFKDTRFRREVKWKT